MIQGYCGLVWELIDTKNTEAQKLKIRSYISIKEDLPNHIFRGNEELYIILEGQGEVSIDSNKYDVVDGICCFHPAWL